MKYLRRNSYFKKGVSQSAMMAFLLISVTKNSSEMRMRGDVITEFLHS